MNKTTREGQSSRERQNIACTQTRQGVAAGRGSDDCPFPNKPILHRRSYKPPTQNSLDPKVLEKMTISKETRGSPLPREQHFDTREAAGSHHRRKDSQRKANGGVHTARAIQVKKLLVGEKLWRVEEQIRQKMSDEAAAAAAANDEVGDESRRRGGGQPRPDKAPTNRERSIQERRHLDDGRLRWRRQGQQEEAKVRDEEEEEEDEDEDEDRWRMRDAAERHYTGGRQRAGRKRNESRSEDTRDQARDRGAWGGMPLRPRDRREASFVDREQSTFPGCRKRNKERPREEAYSRYERPDVPQRHHPVEKPVTDNHRGAEREVPEESPLPPVSSLSLYSQPQREELELAHNTDVRLFPCYVCEKMFRRDRLQTHEKICKKVKVGRKRRPQFVSATQRVYTGDPSPL